MHLTIQVRHAMEGFQQFVRICSFLFTWLLFSGLSYGQFSPGHLSKAHAKLDGPTHCASCHIGGGGGEHKLRCTNCHGEIRERLAANLGLHPSLMGQNRRDDQCAKCHSEHNGEKFVPIRWDVSLEEFDHRKTGYPLEGGHAGLKCDRCHNPDHIPGAARKTILMKDLRHSYMGLSTACLGCHQDQHRGQLGEKCERCHAVAKWKDVTRFDHSTAKFKLTGAHAKTDCSKCHTALPSSESAKPIRYVGMAFTRCGDCHKDPHRGSFAAGCNSCHNDLAWKPARNTVSNFDHSKTKFPLLGKHAPVTCEKCHKTADFKAPVAHEQCKACHQDIHRGQFAARADSGDCASCHTAEGWKPTTFDTAAHAKSAYPLVGKHAAVTCDKCHKPAGEATVYKVRYQECLDCHRDPHESQFGTAPLNNRCGQCHTVERFQPAKYSLSRHNQTRFPLEGAHVAVACTDCHQQSPEFHGAVAYRFAKQDCAGCHRDPHQQQVRNKVATASDRTATACETCHNVRAWPDIASFDHSKTQFPLTGSHRGAACEQCHRANALSAVAAKLVFQNAPMACAGCHEDVHAGQFRGQFADGAGGCDSCHENIKWKPGKFDHQRTDFSLAGAHESVPCKDCHNTRKEVSGRMVLFYKPTPKDCAGCHGPDIRK